jgi:hypothetical protein
MSKELNSKKRKIARGVAFVIVIALAAVGIGIFRYLNPSLGFTYLEPSYLPPGVSIKQKRISILSGGDVEAEQDFRTVDWVYEIMEYKADGPVDGNSALGTANQNYNTDSVSPTCDILSTSRGQQYRLCHWIDYGKIGVYEVKFIEDGTFIDSQIPTTLQQKISTVEISRFVDSFKPKSSIGIPVLRTNF